ncbi:extracellular solute-binding protein [Rhodococcus hoagii]|nr:extracellular solute-binding protein [Prescottella equi]
MGRGEEIADFEAANPGIEIEQFALPDGGSSALAAQLAKDKGVYDLVAVGNATAARLEAGNLLADFDPASVSNLANLPRSTATSSRGHPDRPRQGRDHLRQGEGPESAGLVEGVVRQRLPMAGKIVLPTTTSTSRRSRSSPSATTSTPPTAVTGRRPRRRSRRSSASARVPAHGSGEVGGRRVGARRVGYDYALPAPTIRHWGGSRRRGHAGLHRGRRAAARTASTPRKR